MVERKQQSRDESTNGSGVDHVISCSGLGRTLRSLLTNWTFVTTALYGTCDAMLINGFQAFGPKYIQQQFGLTSSLAALVFGLNLAYFLRKSTIINGHPTPRFNFKKVNVVVSTP